MSLYGDVSPQIERNWGRDDANSQATILFYFNAAQRMLARSYDAPELQASASPTLVVGTSAYDPSVDWSLTTLRKIYSITLVANGRGYEVKYLPIKEWDIKIVPRIPYSTDYIPTWYTQWAKKVELFPAPAEVYPTTLRYYKEAAPVVNASSSVAFDDMDEVLVELTTGLCFLSVEDYVTARQHISIADSLAKKYGIASAFSKDFHQSLSRSVSQDSASGESWANPFIERAP
ncbi:MAG: hypothetical protein ACWGQW_00985 [bacterium]